MTTCTSTTYCATRSALITPRCRVRWHTHYIRTCREYGIYCQAPYEPRYPVFYELGGRSSAKGNIGAHIFLVERYLRCEKSPCDWRIRLRSANLLCELCACLLKYVDQCELTLRTLRLPVKSMSIKTNLHYELCACLSKYEDHQHDFRTACVRRTTHCHLLCNRASVLDP